MKKKEKEPPGLPKTSLKRWKDTVEPYPKNSWQQSVREIRVQISLKGLHSRTYEHLGHPRLSSKTPEYIEILFYHWRDFQEDQDQVVNEIMEIAMKMSKAEYARDRVIQSLPKDAQVRLGYPVILNEDDDIPF